MNYTFYGKLISVTGGTEVPFLMLLHLPLRRLSRPVPRPRPPPPSPAPVLYVNTAVLSVFCPQLAAVVAPGMKSFIAGIGGVPHRSATPARPEHAQSTSRTRPEHTRARPSTSGTAEHVRYGRARPVWQRTSTARPSTSGTVENVWYGRLRLVRSLRLVRRLRPGEDG